MRIEMSCQFTASCKPKPTQLPRTSRPVLYIYRSIFFSKRIIALMEGFQYSKPQRTCDRGGVLYFQKKKQKSAIPLRQRSAMPSPEQSMHWVGKVFHLVLEILWGKNLPSHHYERGYPSVLNRGGSATCVLDPVSSLNLTLAAAYRHIYRAAQAKIHAYHKEWTICHAGWGA